MPGFLRVNFANDCDLSFKTQKTSSACHKSLFAFCILMAGFLKVDFGNDSDLSFKTQKTSSACHNGQ